MLRLFRHGFIAKFQIAFLFAFSVCRIGEASHPGPDAGNQNFVLGVANPTGLRCKATYVAEHLAHGDLWAFSETHLSLKDVTAFNSGLKFAGSPFQPLLGGYPVPSSSDTGSWRCVGVLSKTPVRHIPTAWPAEIAKSSRAVAFTTLIDDVWLTGGVVYGEPDSHYYPSRLAHNEALLQAVTQSVAFLSGGPRFVAGDWNVSCDELPVFGTLASLGFRDLQDLAYERWGIVPRPTCKSRTRKDFCFLSPELQALLLNVEVIADVWPDHAVLEGHFHRLKTGVPKDVWRMPTNFPWPGSFEVPADFWSTHTAVPEVRYQELWSTIESSAAASLPFQVGRSARGRACTTTTTVVRSGKFAPVRVGRRGDFQPHFHGCSFRHAQWVRQARRLQSFVRSLSDRNIVSEYGVQVWAAILRAPGFQGGFARWWEFCQDKVHGAPDILPVFPPEATVACRIFESFVIQVRSLETQLVTSSRQYARLRRAQNPNVIFRDLKPAPVRGVDYLLRPLVATVAEVRAEDSCIVVDPPQPWNDSFPIVSGGLPLEILHATDDCLWLNSLSDLRPGSGISQLQCTGVKEDLEKAFCYAWKARWDRHRDVPEDRCQTILTFARAHLPRSHLDWPSITPEVLGHLISSKHDSSASGLDGVSIQDLKRMPPAVLQNFCSMYEQAETDGTWPPQLLMGKVACLAKVDHPQSVMDYRPITILGMLYRLWGSYHARKAIRMLDPVLPDTLYGSRMACYAGQVWSQLLWAVEDATVHGIALSGLIADLQKAFNHLPRLVVLEAAAILGVPMEVLVAWAGALSQLGRRFQLGSNLTQPVYSVTGLPEGDGLSCLGMLVVDFLFHQWHRHFFPLCEPVSYVDDWTILTTDPSQMEGIFGCLTSFTEALDLLLDTRKTFVWSICSQGRKRLGEQGFQVETSCRMLGAHVQTTRKHTNATQMARVHSLLQLWPRLRMSASSYELKIRAIRVAAWPRGLHAIAATSVSLQAFSSLRAGAMKGLNADGSGCNSMVHLGLVERPITDPHFWTILQTIRLVRECGVPEVVQNALYELTRGNGAFARNGISATLLTRLQMLGWHIRTDGQLEDDFGPFSLFSVCLEEVQWRMEWAWVKVVAAHVSHRQGFADLVCIDPPRTRQWLTKLSVDDRAAYRKLLNGAHITQDGKHYCQEVDTDQCLFCACSDSRFHRFWGCTCFSDCRDHVTSALWEIIPVLPECVTCYGWSLQPTTYHEWYSMLQALSPTSCLGFRQRLSMRSLMELAVTRVIQIFGMLHILWCLLIRHRPIQRASLTVVRCQGCAKPLSEQSCTLFTEQLSLPA